ncbi:TetR/AcrR family transcriptional regulator [Paenibacillus soyae]|uniref:WHG domain-containing protein n=1 Tax=Paenibacillus soyae TaxID=2969249 RepID=A0A9X2MZ18_9BACL|nr:TetR/AcrR family transcriptional regulator [Paenibacillus soyae]MCR2806157.1 WHG domain-containing protein [Paenibacillus soyae]
MSPRAGLDLHTIVRQAAEMADTEGVEAVTLASLAQKLGVRSPSLYNHVNGLPALRSHLAVHGLTLLDEALERGESGKEGEDAIIGVANAYLSFARQHPGLYILTLQSPAVENEEQVRLGERLVARLLHVLKPFGLTEEEGIHAVRGLRSLLHGFAALEYQGGFGMPIDSHASLMYVLHRLLDGLRGSNR